MMKPTLSVIMSAYNEESSIKACLESIITQVEDSFTLHEIIVISDGSQDRTVAVAESIDHPKLRIIAYTDNKGMQERLNEGFKIAQGDFLFKIDADLTLYSPTSLQEMMTAAETTQSEAIIMFREYRNPQTLIQKYAFFWDSLRKKILTQLSHDFFILRVTGGYLLSKEAYRNITIANDVIEEDHFVLLTVLSTNKKASHLETPLMYGNYLTSWNHVVRQYARYTTSTITTQHFSQEILGQYHPTIPRKVVANTLLRHLIRRPQDSIHIFLRIWVILRAKNLKKTDPIKQTW